MGTRSNYRVIENWKDKSTGKTGQNKIALIYCQYDGYPDGHPLDTIKWLASGTVVNGIGMNEPKLIFNGAGCLTAQLICKLKDGPGGTYILPMNHFGLCGENYLYDIIVNVDSTIKIIAYENNSYSGKRVKKKKLFEGTPKEYIDFFSKK